MFISVAKLKWPGLSKTSYKTQKSDVYLLICWHNNSFRMEAESIYFEVEKYS